MDKAIKLRVKAEGLAVKQFFNCGQVGRGFSLDIPFHRTIDYTEILVPFFLLLEYTLGHLLKSINTRKVMEQRPKKLLDRVREGKKSILNYCDRPYPACASSQDLNGETGYLKSKRRKKV